MQPTRCQYLVAAGWIESAWLMAWSLAGAVRTAILCVPPDGALPGEPGFWLCVAVAVPLGALAGLLAGCLPFGVLLMPLFYLLRRRNGSPFAVGDTVRILTGVHRDRIARVHAVWTERCQVRVDLGPEAAHAWTDVFGETQVCRVGDEVATGRCVTDG